MVGFPRIPLVLTQEEIEYMNNVIQDAEPSP